MRRREFIALLGGAAAWPIAAGAQGDRVRRVGVLMGRAGDDEVSRAMLAAFRDEMARLGWREGRNLRVEIRFGGADDDRLRTYAGEFAGLAPDVIVTSAAAATRAAQRETQIIPIVFSGVGDPILNGIVKSVAHPDGNTTGITNLFASIGSKWLQLLKQVAPKLQMVGLIYNDRVSPKGGGFFPSIDEAARALSVQTIRVGYRDAVDLVHGIDSFGAQPDAGLIVLPPAPSPLNRETIIRLATQHQLPTMYQAREYASEGGLMAYGSNVVDRFRRAASFVDHILRGTKVGELPIEYPTKFELVINLKTAKAIDLTVPPTLLALADEIIE